MSTKTNQPPKKFKTIQDVCVDFTIGLISEDEALPHLKRFDIEHIKEYVTVYDHASEQRQGLLRVLGQFTASPKQDTFVNRDEVFIKMLKNLLEQDELTQQTNNAKNSKPLSKKHKV